MTNNRQIKAVAEERANKAKSLPSYVRNKPRAGDTLKYRGELTGSVTRVEGSICYFTKLDGSASLFIWCFDDGLNHLFDWPNKWDTPFMIMGCPSRIAGSRAG